jgi:hypothetical protein
MLRRHLLTLATLATPLRLPLVRYRGRLHGSGAQATILAAALAPTADFVAGSLMSVDGREPQGAATTPTGLRSGAFAATSAGDDLVVAELPWLWRGLLPARFALSFPAWVSQEIQAAQGVPLAIPAAARKEAMRLTRRAGYTVTLGDGASEAARFYHELYRPYVAQRFGAGALVVDEARFRETARGMGLARLHAGGEWIAGLLFRIAGPTLSLGWFGSRTTPPPAGASEALDAWVIGHAAGLGARRAVLGHSRPSLADGVVRYKARFGAVIRATRFPQRVVGIDVRRPTPAVAQALNAARFVTFAGAPGMRELSFRPAL